MKYSSVYVRIPKLYGVACTRTLGLNIFWRKCKLQHCLKYSAEETKESDTTLSRFYLYID
jgi:hypothetical protein